MRIFGVIPQALSPAAHAHGSYSRRHDGRALLLRLISRDVRPPPPSAGPHTRADASRSVVADSGAADTSVGRLELPEGVRDISTGPGQARRRITVYNSVSICQALIGGRSASNAAGTAGGWGSPHENRELVDCAGAKTVRAGARGRRLGVHWFVACPGPAGAKRAGRCETITSCGLLCFFDFLWCLEAPLQGVAILIDEFTCLPD